MNCSSPFPDDDPMLPSGSPPIGRCRVCGDVHRLDLGCPAGDISRGTVVAWVVASVLFAAGFVIGWWVVAR